MRLAGRTGIVTGVEGPFGAAIARALAEAGAELRLGSVDAPRAEALAAELGARVIAPEPEEVAAPDLLVEAAPLPSLAGSLTQAAGWEEMLVLAARPLARFAPVAARMPSGGTVLFVSAIPSATAANGWLRPLLAWREAAVADLGRELVGRGVRVNGLAPVIDGGARLPGFLQREASRPAPPTPMGRAATPAEVAEAALWLLGAGMATGVTLPLNGGRGL